MELRGNSAVKSLVCEFHESYFLTLEINRKLVSERSANFYFNLCFHERIQQSPLQYSALFALRLQCVDLMTFSIINQNVRTSQELDLLLITTSENTFSEIH